MVAQAAVPRASTKVVHTIWLEGSFAWDNADDRAIGSNWNIAEEVCSSLQSDDWFKANGLNNETPKCVVSSVKQQPKYGKLVRQKDGSIFNYYPKQGFTGKDIILLIVHAEGKKILVVWQVFVTEHELIIEA